MTALESRIAKLEDRMVPEAPDLRRVIQIVGSVDLEEEQVTPWLIDHGVDLFKNDFIIHRTIIRAVEPGTMACSFTGEATIYINDPATDGRQTIHVRAAA